MRPARIPLRVLRTSSFPSKARATRRGSRLKNSAVSKVAWLSEFGRNRLMQKLRARQEYTVRIGIDAAISVLAPRLPNGRTGTPGAPPESSRRTLQICQDFVGVAFGFYVVEDVFDFAIGAYDESGPRYAFHFFAVHVFFLDHAEPGGDFLVGIG